MKKRGKLVLLFVTIAILFGCSMEKTLDMPETDRAKVTPTAANGWVRTVVYIYKPTTPGQDIFIKGGHDAGLVNQGIYPSMSEDITYNNTNNTTTYSIKMNDTSLDWGSESALDWTCNVWPPEWGTKRVYQVDGYGEDAENTFGMHWWKFDVMMRGNVGDWFEFKAFMRENGNEWWENDISQAGTPYSTINHWGKKGYITVVSFGQNDVQFIELEQPPTSNSLTVYFKKPKSWANTPYVYYWGSDCGTVNWPGVVMTAAPEEGADWYKYTFSGTSTYLIFNNQGQPQTADLFRDKVGYYYTDNVWYDTNPESGGNRPPVANAGPDIYITVGGSANFDGSQSYDPDGSIVSYTWDNGLSGVNPSKVYNTPGTYVVTLTVTDNEGATATDTVNVIVSSGTTSSWDFREETIYFVITSRFYDGDPANNVHCWDDNQAGNPDSDPAWRGDFAGLIQKLDYIKALGFSAIWITPVVKNASGYDYHGYHAINFQQVDPRLESPGATYQDFINVAHAKGFKVIQDIVLNHTGNFGEENLFPLFTRNAPTGLNETIDDALTMTDPSNLLPANYYSLTPAEQYNARIAAMKEDYNDTGHIYHHEKSMGWESYTVQTGQIAGDCVDLNTENPVVQNYLIDAYNQYIDMGVDAFRIDTVKHISRLTFNKVFIPAFKQRGGDDFYIFGEVCTRYRQIWNSGIPAISTPFYTWKEFTSYPWGTRTQNESSTYQHWQDNSTVDNEPTSDNHYLYGNSYHTPDWTMRSGLDVIDFPMHWNFANAHDAFNVAVSGDQYYSDATWNVTYVDSHDYAPDTAPENQRFALGQDVWAENLSLIFTFRGIPTIFYGSEIEFQKGKPIDVGPNAPLSTTGRAYFGDYIEGSVNVTDFGIYTSATGAMADTLNYPLAKHIRALNLIRRNIPALQKGQYSTTDCSPNWGAIAFKRAYTDGNGTSFALIAISGGATFYNIPNGTYKDAVTGDVKYVSNGTLPVNMYGKGNLRVYVLNGTFDLSQVMSDNGPYLN